MTLLLITALLLQDPEQEHQTLMAEQAKKQRAMDGKIRAAHKALDERKYDEAVTLAKEAHALKDELVKMRERARAILKKLVPELAAQFEDEAYETREAASRRLKALGPSALPLLIRLRPDLKSAESRSRVDALLGDVSFDDKGRLRQWASEAEASSEYGSDGWSARQATGAPDTPAGGDLQTAWAPKEQDRGEEWLRVKFRHAVRMAKLRIRETHTPGGVVAVDAVGPDGARRRIWEGADPGGAAPVWLEIDIKDATGRELVIVLDTKKTAGWEEIDAVELIGEPADE